MATANSPARDPTSSSSPATFITPTKRAAFISSEAGPSRVRPSGVSPAYSSRRHSLYGVEDRVVIDPGSRIWKVGYSGEYDPRAVFSSTSSAAVQGEDAEDARLSGAGIWELDLAATKGASGDREEGRRLVEARVLRLARETFIKHLMTDSKTRKVIVLENTYLPAFVKEAMAKALFDNLKVPSISFTSSSVLALTACGRSTGLVVDVGWHETTITPVFHSRPLYHLSRSTPLAGRVLHRRVKVLLLRYARYRPAPVSISETRPIERDVPLELLTDELVQEVITKRCVAGDVSGGGSGPSAEPEETRQLPEAVTGAEENHQAACLEMLYQRYIRNSSNAGDVAINIKSRKVGKSAIGPGTLVIPGRIRSRAIEVLYGDDLGEADTIQDTILNTALKLPVDLRSVMLSNILITGGTAMMPNFIPRLRETLLTALTPPAPPTGDSSNSPSTTTPTSPPLFSPDFRVTETKAWRYRHLQPYKLLYPLKKQLAILNDPSPLTSVNADMHRGGKAPRWTPALVSWVGGSLAGALKTGGLEMTREEYDTRAAIHIEKGEVYERTLEAQLRSELEAGVSRSTAEAGGTASENMDTDPDIVSQNAPPTLVDSGRVIQGVKLEDLLPGMALAGGASGRKRGWKSEVRLNDWTRVVKA